MVPHLLDHWTGSQTAGEVADAITNSWNLITEKYGLSQQRSFYRDILGLPPYTPPPPGLSSTAILSFALPITLVLIILLVIVMKQRHVIKYRTRDVDSGKSSIRCFSFVLNTHNTSYGTEYNDSSIGL